MILLTELEAYAFLLKHFTEDDVRYKRLKLRKPEYESMARELYDKVRKQPDDDKEWLPAKRTLDELARRFQYALKQDIELPSARAMTPLSPSRAA